MENLVFYSFKTFIFYSDGNGGTKSLFVREQEDFLVLVYLKTNLISKNDKVLIRK